MGTIAELSRRKMQGMNPEQRLYQSPTDRGEGRELWRQVFGRPVQPQQQRPVRPVRADGGSFGNSSITTKASVTRLLDSLRSMAPGGWSDNRWEETKHFVGIAYVAIHRKASMMAQSTVKVYRADPMHPDGKVLVENVEQPGEPGHDLLTLLRRPNPQDSFGKWMYRVTQQKDLTGTALTWMVPNKMPNLHTDQKYYGWGTPFEMYCIPTAIAIPQPAINPDYPDGFYRIQPVYPYGPFSSYPTPATAVGAPIPAQWVLRFQYPHPLLRYEGYSPLTGMRLNMDVFESIDRSRWYGMKKTFKPNVLMETEDQEGAQPLPDAEIDRIRSMIESAFMGPENVGGLFVPPPGYRMTEFGSRPIDMDYPNGWEQLLAFILGGFGITKPAAGMVEDAAYATLFATLKQLHTITLKPEVDDIAADLTYNLAPFFGEGYFIEIELPRIDDHEVLFNKVQIAMAAKAITKNGLLKLLDLPVTQELWGEDIAGDPSPNEVLMAQQQMMMAQPPLESSEQGQEGDQNQNQGEESFEDESGVNDEFSPVPEEEAFGQPTPNTLNRGSLGPRKSFTGKIQTKSLNGRMKKSLYQQLREVMRNGH